MGAGVAPDGAGIGRTLLRGRGCVYMAGGVDCGDGETTRRSVSCKPCCPCSETEGHGCSTFALAAFYLGSGWWGRLGTRDSPGAYSGVRARAPSDGAKYWHAARCNSTTASKSPHVSLHHPHSQHRVSYPGETQCRQTTHLPPLYLTPCRTMTTTSNATPPSRTRPNVSSPASLSHSRVFIPVYRPPSLFSQFVRRKFNLSCPSLTTVSQNNPLLQAELARIEAHQPLPPLDTTRYQLPGPTESTATVEDWEASLRNANAQLEHQRLRCVANSSMARGLETNPLFDVQAHEPRAFAKIRLQRVEDTQLPNGSYRQEPRQGGGRPQTTHG